jgi:hypothetical protein
MNSIDILKIDAKTGEILEKTCFVDGDKFVYQIAINDAEVGYFLKKHKVYYTANPDLTPKGNIINRIIKSIWT